MLADVRRTLSSLGVFLAVGVAPLAAQQGTVAGRVVDEETGQPLSTAQVQVLGAGGQQATGVLSENDGTFRIRLAPGSYSLVSSLVGYGQARIDGVAVTAGQTTQVEISMTSTAFELNPVVVTASRRQEKILDSPSNIQIVPTEQIEERTVLQPTEHIRNLPGVDMAQNGLTSSAVVTRGFNNVFSGGLLVLVDNRIASVPSLRVNQFNMIPTSQPDIERMEVLLGPAAALYGPNSANGVLHIITSSPLDDPGTTASIAGGERNVFQTQFSTSHILSETVGLRVGGNYMQGDDWEYTDPVEVREAEANPDNPLIGNRDFNTERYGGEFRLDIRPWDDGEVILSAGLNNLASSVELTGQGAGQGQDWIYSYVQARINKGGFFAQAFLNQSDAGDTFLLRTGQPIIDKSRMLVGQIQYAFDMGENQEFISGIDVQRTEPRTEGTITGRNEDDDIINEVGGYLHSETALSESLSLVAALRVDYHNRIEDLVYSPRAALVFKPSSEHTFRATFNRAFSTPTTNNLFLDLRAGSIPIPGTPGYDVRTLGVPESGFTFMDECAGGIQSLCMYSPFAPGTQLPANGAVLWNGLVQGLLPADLQPLLLTAPGEVPAVASTLRRFNQEADDPANAFPLDQGGPEAIDRIIPTITNTFEVGWKGLLGSKLLISADVYSSQITDFVGPLRVETPTVFYDPASLQDYVVGRLTDAANAGAIPASQVPVIAGEVVPQLAGVPLGTVAPDQAPGTDLILTYRNFGDVDLWGADLGFQFLATDRVSFSGSTSYVSEECFDFNDDGGCGSASDISLNAPTFKGSLGVRFSDKFSGFSAETRMRYSEGFAMNSGVFIGDVPEYTVFDANIAYQLPWATGATVSLTGTNIFDNMRREFVGAPQIGRLVMIRLQYAF